MTASIASSGAGRDDIDWRHGAPLPVARPRCLGDLFAMAQQDAQGAVVIRDGPWACTWEDLDCWSGRLARQWRHIGHGDRIAIVAQNGLGHLLAELAAWRLGAVAVPMSPLWERARLLDLISLIAPMLLIADDPALAPSTLARGALITVSGLLEAVQESGSGWDRASGPGDACLIQFTSGSTGRPRGVCLDQDNLCSQQAAFALLWPEVGPGDRLASFLPWHHSFGGLAERLWALCRGATLTVVPKGGHDRELLFQSIRSVRPTVFMSVPKIHRLALAEEVFAPGSMRWAFSAGATLGEEIMRGYEALSIPVHEGWGLTETSPSAVISPPGQPRVSGVVGQPIPGVAVGVRRNDGRIFVSGPNVMRGYFGDPVASLAGMDSRVVDSGDVGSWCADGLRLLGRADQMLKLANGEKVPASVIEAQLSDQGEVVHAVVLADDELIALIEGEPGCRVDGLLEAVGRVNAAQAVPYWKLARVYRITQPLSVAAEELIPSLKVSRSTVIALFQAWRQGRHPGRFEDLGLGRA